jgi:hypothetical protein
LPHGPTGPEEYRGCGFGIALTVSADEQTLHFHGDHYFLTVACGSGCRAGSTRAN